MAGEWDVGKIERGMSGKRFLEWEMYMQLEPFGELRADLRAASIVQVIANVNRGKKQKPYTLEECMLKFGQEPQKSRQTPEQQMAMLRILAMQQALVHKQEKRG